MTDELERGIIALAQRMAKPSPAELPDDFIVIDTRQPPPKPFRVPNIEDYWQVPPPRLSPRCSWWLVMMTEFNWRPNRRVRRMGYYERAGFYGVYIWEACKILSHFEYTPERT